MKIIVAVVSVAVVIAVCSAQLKNQFRQTKSLRADASLSLALPTFGPSITGPSLADLLKGINVACLTCCGSPPCCNTCGLDLKDLLLDKESKKKKEV